MTQSSIIHVHTSLKAEICPRAPQERNAQASNEHMSVALTTKLGYFVAKVMSTEFFCNRITGVVSKSSSQLTAMPSAHSVGSAEVCSHGIFSQVRY